MGWLTDNELIQSMDRITKQYSLSDFISEAFPEVEEQKSFVAALSELSETGAEFKVGGRRLREMLGFKTDDFAKDIRFDGQMLAQDPIKTIRLREIIKILKKYPEERMVKPDLDFFTSNIEPEKTSEVFSKHGFNVKLNRASGNVTVVTIEGDKGMATFIDENETWQIGDQWPMFGFTAKLKLADVNPIVDLNIGYGRLYLYPLEIPGRYKSDPLDPVRFAAVSRTLLWALTVSDPYGNRLRLPFPKSDKYYLDTVSQVQQLLDKIRENPELEIMYRGGLRDMAIVIRMCELTDWYELMEYHNYPTQRGSFFQNIAAAWFYSRTRYIAES